MAIQSTGKAFVTNLKELCTYQLIIISHSASNMLFVADSHPASSSDPRENFIESVKVLDSYLTVVWDDDYKNKRIEIWKGLSSVQTKLASAYLLLQACMALMDRQGILAYTKQIEL